MKNINITEKYAMIQRLLVIACLFVLLIASITLIWVLVTLQIILHEAFLFNEIGQLAQEKEENDNIIVVSEPKTTNIPVIEKVEENLSEWCLANESIDYSINLWKLTDQEGNLFIALKNDEGEVLSTFKYEGIETNYYDEWVRCDDFFEQVTIKDIGDYSFTSYHEVSGNNPENVQAQVCVLINRQNCENYYSDSIREVITEKGQYACSKQVENRRLKSDNFLERKDLEKCYRQALLVLSGELIQEVPTNVVFAATGAQGSGIWKEIDGTFYCFSNKF